jgi:glycosyltransferase involved in cell wall biosynthesis
MKIIYVAHSLLSRGGDKMVLAQAARLSARGHDVELCCNVVDTILNIPEGVRISKPLFPGTFGTVLSALIQRRNADFVLASIIPMACFLFPRSRGKVVYYAQDFDEAYYTSAVMKWLVRIFYYLGLRVFEIPVISVSDLLAGILTKRFNARVCVAENGVDSGIFYHDPDNALVSAKGKRKSVLILSRSDHRKGFDIAQLVIGRLMNCNSGVYEVWTVGESCKGIFPGVVHRDFGYVNEARLREIMSSADLFLYPTRHEGFGLMPLEALACRCPVVTTEAVPYARDGFNAMVSAVNDVDGLMVKVEKLSFDDNTVQAIRSAGAVFAENQSLEHTLDAFYDCLMNLAVSSERL